MSTFKGRMARLSAAACLLCAAALPAHAGIPVYDATNDVKNNLALLQFAEEVANQLTQIGHQITQIEHLYSTVTNMSGTRLTGYLLRNTGLDNYVPLNAINRIANIRKDGLGGLTARAKAMRDAARFYNCEGVSEPSRKYCEAELAQPWEVKAVLDQAMETASGRIAHIGQLMDAINDTDDQAGKLEIGARIGAEQALLQQEQNRIALLAQQVQVQDRIDRMQRRERTAAMLREGKSIADFMKPAGEDQ